VKLVTLAVDALVEVLVEEDDTRKAARAAVKEFKKDPQGTGPSRSSACRR
jgi:hypothetical protein